MLRGVGCLIAVVLIAGGCRSVPPNTSSSVETLNLVPSDALALSSDSVQVRPERIRIPVPVFPKETNMRALLPGRAVLEVTIDGRGKVVNLRIISLSSPELTVPVLKAFEQAVYAPVLDSAGNPLRVRFIDSLEF